MAPLNEAKVCLCVSGAGLDPSEISRRLIRPDLRLRAGRPHGGPCCDGMRLVEGQDRWTLVAPHATPEDLDRQVKRLLVPLTDDENTWRDIGRDRRVVLHCAFLMHRPVEEMAVAPATFAMLARRGIALSAAIYTADAPEQCTRRTAGAAV